ncbi:MAG: lysophospholipase [Anaerolineae bacterium]|jgi:alpha-beta hydrolase superfamily lysophospholipase
MEHTQGTFEGNHNTELYCQAWRPQAPPRAALAVVHGFGEYSERYHNLVDWFVPRGYAVHAFDLRGHGRSPGVRGHVDSFADYRADVRAFLDHVRRREPGRPLFLVGHSQGGLIVLNYVLHDPSGLHGVVASAPALGQLPVSPFLILLARTLSRLWPRLNLETGLDVHALSRDPAVVEAYVNDPLVHNTATPRLGTELMAAVDWTQAHAADLALPCLIVHGTADSLCLPETSQAFFEKITYPDRDRIDYEGYYHELFNEPDRDRVLADVYAWLEAHLD